MSSDEIAVSRRKARVPARRVGILLVNPGGPGLSAFDYVADTEILDKLPAVVLDSFDIIGLEPRGLPRSLPVLCSFNSPGGFDRRERNERYAESCKARSGSLLRFVGSDSSAEDMETLRKALGEEKISLLGFSYGTYLGALYAEAHPARVRAMVLDSGVDPSRFGRTYAQDIIRGKQRIFEAALEKCFNRVDEVCPYSSVNEGLADFDRLAALARTDGLGDDNLDSSDLESLTVELLEKDWDRLFAVLTDLRIGDSASAKAALDSVNSGGGAWEDGSFESVVCRDGLRPSSWPQDTTGVDEETVLRTAAPSFPNDAAFWASESTCANWGAPPRQRTDVRSSAGARILTVAGFYDINTPYEWSVNLNAQLGGSLLRVEGTYGHALSFDGVQCLDSAVTAFLLTPQPPDPEVTC